MKPVVKFAPKDGVFPFRGMDYFSPSSQSKSNFGQWAENIDFRFGRLTRRDGTTQIGGGMTDPILAMPYFNKLDGANQTLAVTTKRVFLQSSTSLSLPVGSGGGGGTPPPPGPAVGVAEVEGWTLLDAQVVDLSTCEDATDWATDSGEVTLADDASDKKENTKSLKATVTDVFTTGCVFYHDDFSPVIDISGSNTVRFWFKSSIDLDAGDASLIISETTKAAAAGDYIEFLLPEIVADTWYLIEGSTPDTGTWASMDAALSVGLFINEDKNLAAVYHLDYVRTCYAWTGDEDDWVDYCIGSDTSGDYVFMTNGKDTPLVWDGTTLTKFAFAAGKEIAGFVTCRTFEFFYGSLMMGNITVASNAPKTIAASVVGDLDNFLVGDGAIYDEFPDLIGAIIKLLRLGDSICVYSDSSYGVINYVGGVVLYTYETLISGGFTFLSGRGIISLGNVHLGMCAEGIFTFDGTKTLTRKSILVDKLYQDNTSITYKNRSFAFFDLFNRRLYMVFSKSETESTVLVLTYAMNLTDLESFGVFTFPYRITSFGFFKSAGGFTWDMVDDPITKAALAWSYFTGTGVTWADFAGQPSTPKIIIGDSEGEALFLDPTVDYDRASTTVVPFVWESLDIVPDEIRQSEHNWWLQFEVDVLCKSSGQAFYSIDGGKTWTNFSQSILPSPSESKIQVMDLDVVSKKIRVKLVFSSFADVREYRLWYSYGGLE